MTEKLPPRQRVLVDFDEVIHVYPKDWRERIKKGETTLTDEEVQDAFASIRKLREQNVEVVIFTARKGLIAVKKWIARKAPDLDVLTVTNIKMGSDVIVDDRAVTFKTWAQALPEVNAALKLRKQSG